MPLSENLSSPAQRLITRYVDSVGTLDLLLLIHHERERDWSLDELREQLRAPAAWTAEQLGRLATAGVLVELDGRFRYQPDHEFGTAVDELARHDRAAVTRMIFARPPAPER